MANSTTLINNAKKYIGKPYVWGGESMSEGGYDCSGYMYNVLKDSGYNVNRTTAQGFYNSIGTKVSSPNVGDLIFFGKSTSAITHIAMFAGNGKMYESIGGSRNTKNNPGKGVTLSSSSRRSDIVAYKRIASDATTNTSTTSSKCNTHLRDLQSAINADKIASLVTDGIWGTNSKNAVKKCIVKNGSKGNITAWVQCRVGTTADGVSGYKTVACIKTYQSKKGLISDGCAGYNTITSLLRDYGVNC